MVSEEWRTMKNEERTKWEKMAQDDKKRFETEKATYRGPWTVPIGHRKSKVGGQSECIFLQTIVRSSHSISHYSS